MGKEIYLIVGLGNLGEKYAHTRHNAGFDVMDILSAKLNVPIRKLKFQSTYGEALIGGERFGRGVGKNKQDAGQKAAEDALSRLYAAAETEPESN